MLGTKGLWIRKEKKPRSRMVGMWEVREE
jgi:hypothetical protein